MPIGKNAIKRISNNGYSNVKAEAPDMENSEVSVDKAPVAKKKPQAKRTPKNAPKVEPKREAPKPQVKPVAKSAPKKTTPKRSAPKKSMESEPSLAPVKTLERVVEKKQEVANKGYLNIGDELPVYLL